MKITVTHHVIQAFLAVVMAPSFATALSESNTSDVEEARIVGGYDAEKGRYPYMVSLQSWSRHECGAVLVAPDVVLTAAHCIDDDVKKAFLNRLDLKDDTEADSQVIDINYYVRHPDYTLDSDRHDVGVFKLMEQTNLPPIVMNQDPYLLVDGMSLTVMGFGDLGNFTYPTILQEVQVNYIPDDACRDYEDPMRQGESYKSMIFSDMMCALGEGKDGCSGDSGGPLVVRGDTYQNDVLVGIVSWGIGCARLPGVYARVDAMFDWISATVCRVSANPPAYLQCSQAQPASTPTAVAPTPPSPAPVPELVVPSPVAVPVPALMAPPPSAAPVAALVAPSWPPQMALFGYDASSPAVVVTDNRKANYDGGDVPTANPTLADDISSGDVRLRLWVACLLLLLSTMLLAG